MGGDKYAVTWDNINNDRDRFFYIPQNHSRDAGKPKQTIILTVQTTEPSEEDETPWMSFTLVKQAKGSGDDRYHNEDAEVWKGDIYLPKELRLQQVWVKVE